MGFCSIVYQTPGIGGGGGGGRGVPGTPLYYILSVLHVNYKSFTL